jgi:hypothetical protein
LTADPLSPVVSAELLAVAAGYLTPDLSLKVVNIPAASPPR